MAPIQDKDPMLAPELGSRDASDIFSKASEKVIMDNDWSAHRARSALGNMGVLRQIIELYPMREEERPPAD